MNDLERLKEMAGIKEGDYRYPAEWYADKSDDDLHVAFEQVYLHIRETDAQKAAMLLDAMNKVWLILDGKPSSDIRTRTKGGAQSYLNTTDGNGSQFDGQA